MHDKREEKEVAELQRYLFNGEGRKTWLTDDVLANHWSAQSTAQEEGPRAPGPNEYQPGSETDDWSTQPGGSNSDGGRQGEVGLRVAASAE
jgi:hypothetical protein